MITLLNLEERWNVTLIVSSLCRVVGPGYVLVQPEREILVVVLLGGDVPYVIRLSNKMVSTLSGKVSRRVEFIRECYLPGYMTGEGMQNKGDEIEFCELV